MWNQSQRNEQNTKTIIFQTKEKKTPLQNDKTNAPLVSGEKATR